jgi:hypothetical protein
MYATTYKTRLKYNMEHKLMIHSRDSRATWWWWRLLRQITNEGC